MHEPILTPAHMTEADARTISGGTPGDVLMERAGFGCFRETVRLGGGIGGRRFLVLAGPGNNGGDGFVVARLLRNAGAWVRCTFVGDVDRLTGDAATNLERMRRVGVHADALTDDLPPADVAVDALFGTGLTGPLRGDTAPAVERLNRLGAAVLAVDIPSGVNGETGDVDEVAVRADVTVTMQAVKPGLVLEPGAEYAGRVVREDIGISLDHVDAELADPLVAAAQLPVRPPNAHKWAVGSVLAIGGSVGMSGAPTMVSLAAFHAGAGLVVCGVPEPVQPLVAGRVLEVMTVPLPAADGKLTPAALDMIDDKDRYAAVALGPGLGQGSQLIELVQKALVEVAQPLVLDADGLNVIGGNDLTVRRAPTVVTPHEGEFRRLGADLTAGGNRIDAVRIAAEHWGVTVLLKGPSTIVATPGREPTVCRTGGPELATAGSGDTLTGTIAAYLARGVEPHAAAVAAACVNGVAGRLAASDRGWITAGDVSRELGRAEEALRE